MQAVSLWAGKWGGVLSTCMQCDCDCITGVVRCSVEMCRPRAHQRMEHASSQPVSRQRGRSSFYMGMRETVSLSCIR